jgi:signal transduction histidine kinase/GAF domain-containing protein
LLVSQLVEDAVKIVHDSPVECLGGVLRLIVSAVGCDYGLILTRDPQKQALSVDVVEGYADEQSTAYRSERIKLPANETQSVSARALAEANREGKPVFILLSGDDPSNYEIAPVEQTLACAVGSVGEYVSVLVLERKQNSKHKPFVDGPELRTFVKTCVQLVSIALAARQSFVFKFDEFMKQAAFDDFEQLSKEVGHWVFEKFRVALCSLYFVEYDTKEGREILACRQRVVKGVSGSDVRLTRLMFGEDYAGWVAANNSSLITFTDSKNVIHITSASVLPEAQLQPASKLSEIYPALKLKSYLGVPITDGSQMIGILEVVDDDREYSYSDEELLEIIADRIGAEYTRISRDVRRESLFDIPNIETRDLRLVIRGVVDTAMKVAAATHGLFMFKEENGVFTPKAVCGHGLEKTMIQAVKVGDEDLTNWVMSSPGKAAFVSGDIRSVQIADAALQEHINNTLAPQGFIPANIKSVLMVPIYLKDAKEQTDDLGVLVLMSPRLNVFQRDEVVITALAEIVSYHIWANKKTAELESTSEKIKQLEQAMPHYNKAAMAAAASAGTVHSAKKHVTELKQLIEKLNDHQRVRETRELLEISRTLQTQFAELADLYDKLHAVFRGSEPTFEPSDVGQLVQEVRSYMDPKFRERHVSFKNLVTTASLPKVHLDPILMKVVFINLINNSIDAHAREISVGAKKTSIVTGGVSRDAIEMTFKDNGDGIPPENLPKIFELFFTDGKKEGTGLGLAVNSDIMEKHGGTIKVVSSTQGQGTAFSLVWPMNP